MDTYIENKMLKPIEIPSPSCLPPPNLQVTCQLLDSGGKSVNGDAGNNRRV